MIPLVHESDYGAGRPSADCRPGPPVAIPRMASTDADPAFSELDILLIDGSAAHVRDIRSSDADLLREFHARLSTRSIAFRYLGPHPTLSDKEVARFTSVDRIDRVALVVERGGRIVAVARYDRPPGSEQAEVAFVVQDEFQGLGLGTILLEQLAIIARRHCIRRFLADTFSENRRMLGVFRDSGFPRRYSRDSGVVQVVLDIVTPPEPAAGAAAAEAGRPRNILGPPTLPSESRRRQP